MKVGSLICAFAVVLLLAGLTGCAGVIREDPVNVYSPHTPPSERSSIAYDLPPVRRVDLRGGQPYRHFATYGQCQMELSHSLDPLSGLPVITDDCRTKVEDCISLAVKEKVNVLILRERSSDCPSFANTLSDLVEPVFKRGSVRSLPYDTLVAAIPPFQEGMLIYDVNLRLLREPASTNAPDQGHPVVRNVKRILLEAP